MTKKFAAGLVAITLLFATTAMAQDVHPMDEESTCPEVELNLTEEQETQMDELSYRISRKGIRHMADLDLAEMELQRLMDNRETSEKELSSAVENVMKAEHKLRLLEVEEGLSMRDILTPEQWKEMIEAEKNCPMFEEFPYQTFTYQEGHSSWRDE